MAKIRKSENEEVSYWLSYSDMLAALLLMFALIISFTLMESKIQYEKKVAEIAKQQEEIAKQQETINKLLGVKSDIIEDLVIEFDNSGLQMEIDKQTGDIIFNSDLLFDPNQAVLRPDSITFLDAFLPQYFGILLSDEYIDNIAEIIIEGHTAEYGTYLGCVTLSQSRALAVATYATKDDSVLKDYIEIEKLREILTVNGRAYYDLIFKEDGTRDDQKSRRVEIKFRLKDDEIIEELKDYLQ